MKKYIPILALSMLYLGATAQTQTKVNVNETEGKYHIKVEKEVDGKKTTIDKTYSSLEEMKNDPELAGLNLHVFEGNSHQEMVFSGHEGTEGDHKVKVMVELDSEAETDSVNGTSSTFIFKSDSDDEALHEIKVWVDENGQQHIMKNGEEIVMGGANSWTDKDGKEYTIKKMDGKIMVMTGEDISEFNTADGETFYFSDNNGHKGKEHKVMIFRSSDNDGEHRNIAVEEVKHLVIRLEEIKNTDEFRNLPGIDAKVLKMDEVIYYPNPNNGKLTLQFKADRHPTQVKITSIDGKSIYTEDIHGFEGHYNKEIDLSSQKKGVYLLQIIQGNKAVNKKIVIE
jgi:Secretion system C-terminal sorting domain